MRQKRLTLGRAKAAAMQPTTAQKRSEMRAQSRTRGALSLTDNDGVLHGPSSALSSCGHKKKKRTPVALRRNGSAWESRGSASLSCARRAAGDAPRASHLRLLLSATVVPPRSILATRVSARSARQRPKAIDGTPKASSRTRVTCVNGILRDMRRGDRMLRWRVRGRSLPRNRRGIAMKATARLFSTGDSSACRCAWGLLSRMITPASDA